MNVKESREVGKVAVGVGGRWRDLDQSAVNGLIRDLEAVRDRLWTPTPADVKSDLRTLADQIEDAVQLIHEAADRL